MKGFRLTAVIAAAALLGVFSAGGHDHVPSAAAATASPAKCSASEKAKRVAALSAYKRKMASTRHAYFRTHRGGKARRAFIKRQQAKLRALKRGAACTVPSSTTTPTTPTPTPTTPTTTPTTTTPTTTTPTPPPPPANGVVTVTKVGSGSGAVTSEPAGINCGSTCAASFAGGTSVTLTATASAGPDQRFLDFSGDCTPQTDITCTTTINGDRSVTARFGHCAASYPTVCIPPPPPDLDCGDISYDDFTVIYNVANPDPHRFDGDKDGVGCES